MAGDSLELFRKRAKEAISHGEYEEALKIYGRALLFRGDNADLHYGAATVHYMLGNLDKAAEHFKLVIQTDPMRANAHINLGAVYHRMGQYEESLVALQRGMQLDPNRAEGHYNLALVYKHFGEIDLAIDAYREAIRLNPRLVEAHLNLGNLFRDKGQFPLASVHYQHVLELRPDCEKARAALDAVQAQVADGDNAVAVQILTEKPKAKPFDPDRMIDPVIYGNLLRDLHHQIIDLDGSSQVMLTFVQKQLEEAIRELSICILTPNDPKHDLDKSTRKFDEMVVRLLQVHQNLQKHMLRTKSMGEQLIKT